MRSLLLMIALCSTAAAGPAPLQPLDLQTLPASCRDVAAEPASARTLEPRLASYVSAANCMAMVRTHAVALAPTQEAIASIDVAIGPSLTLLDAVIEQGDVDAAMMAQYAKADLYSGAAVAMRRSVPAAASLTGAALVAHDAQLDDVVALTRPWLDQARDGFREVARLAATNPELVEHDPVLAFEVADSSAEQGPGVAIR